ncbi:MAG: hypothetical protein K6B38_11710 [Ruminococcus sp.]|nr:hypothetical protein [Ruminococcus sp.]
MRDYEEVSRTVMRRRDEQLAKDRHRMYIWKRSGAAALSLCFAGALAFGIHNHGISKPQREHDNDENIIVSEAETSVTVSAHDDIPTTTATVSAVRTDKSQTSVSKGTETSSAVITASSAQTVSVTSVKAASTAKVSVDSISASEATSAVISAPETAMQNTTVSQAVTTSVTLSQTVPTVTTAINLSPDENDERSVYIMKRFAAFAAAMLTASTVIPTIPYAAENYNVRNIPHTLDETNLRNEENYVKTINEKGLDLDVNSDGVFDNFDCYLISRFTPDNSEDDHLGEAIHSKIEALLDLNDNGVIETAESYTPYYHYLFNCDIDPVIFAQSTYEEYDKTLGLPSRGSSGNYSYGSSFVSELGDRCVFLGVDYLFLEKMIDDGMINPDINGDGVFDIDDVADLYIFDEGDPWIRRQDPETGLYEMECSPDKRIVLDEEIEARAKAATIVQRERNSGIDAISASSLLDCLFRTAPILPEYSEDSYYEKFHENAEYYYIGDLVRNYRYYMGIDKQDKTLDEYEKEFMDNQTKAQQFIEDIKAGKLSTPDLNYDNVIDAQDYRILELYHGDRVFGRTAEESKLPKDVYENLQKNCDFNENGESGDDGDLDMVRSFISSYIHDQAVKEATDENGNVDDRYATAIYLNTLFPDGSYAICYEYGLYDDKDAEDRPYRVETQEKFYQQYIDAIGNGEAAPPDVDGNGIIETLDADYAASYFNYLDTGEFGDTEIPADVVKRIETLCDFHPDGRIGQRYDMLMAILYVERVVNSEQSASAKYSADLEKERSGDANVDGNLTMADAVIIMQSYVNPEKYHITEEGRYNADIHNTGDGITPKDALAIQEKLLKK